MEEQLIRCTNDQLMTEMHSRIYSPDSMQTEGKMADDVLLSACRGRRAAPFPWGRARRFTLAGYWPTA